MGGVVVDTHTLWQKSVKISFKIYTPTDAVFSFPFPDSQAFPGGFPSKFPKLFPAHEGEKWTSMKG